MAVRAPETIVGPCQQTPSPRPAPGQLTFTAPRRGKPPRHLADLTLAERREAATALGAAGVPRRPAVDATTSSGSSTGPSEMTDLPKAVRDDLVADLLPTLLTPVRSLTADRGATVKRSGGSSTAPSSSRVLMRYPDRVTVCISSQAGCGMNCPFCATGQDGLTRNMSTAEIVEQVVYAARLLRRGELPAMGGDPHGAGRRRGRRVDGAGRPSRVSNVVFMGMGEPLANYKAGDRRGPPAHRPGPDGLGISARGITVSTVGLVPGDRQARRRGHPGDARPVAARARRRAARRARADQHPVEGRRGPRRRPPLLRGRPGAGSASSTP